MTQLCKSYSIYNVSKLTTDDRYFNELKFSDLLERAWIE